METLISPRCLSPPLSPKSFSSRQTKLTSSSSSFSTPNSFCPKYQYAKFAKPESSLLRHCLSDSKQSLASLPSGSNDSPPEESYDRATESNQKRLLAALESPMNLLACPVGKRSMIMGLLMSGLMITEPNLPTAFASTSVFREYIDTFDGYSFKYPQNWIQVRGAGADIFFRDPVVLDENLSVEFSSPSSSKYNTLEDLGSPDEAGKKVLRQYLTEFMSTRLGVKRESNILATSSRVADDGKLYYQIEVNIKSYANNNELAVMPQDRVARLEWDRRYMAVLGVENNRLYSLRLQTPEKVFQEEEKDLRRVMDSFRVEKI